MDVLDAGSTGRGPGIAHCADTHLHLRIKPTVSSQLNAYSIQKDRLTTVDIPHEGESAKYLSKILSFSLLF